MLNPKSDIERSEFYDAELTAIDLDSSTLQFTTTAGVRHVSSVSAAWWTARTIGRLRLKDSSFAFLPYPDQRLRHELHHASVARALGKGG